MADESPEKQYCYVHPDRETLLRCNRCERPMCTSCAVLTPTGYRCRECVRGQQKIFDTARWWDYPLTVLTAGGLAVLGSLVAGWVGFFIIFIAPIVGTIIAEAVRFVVRKRRSRRLPLVAAGAALVGSLLRVIISLVVLLLSNAGVGAGLLGLLWPTVFAILVTSTVYYRLKGIRI
ncbi:MAG TPA: hypothetical protein PK040_05340 [Anaerolineaceae bacterium]|nr:hypothetical protein [Anaerolineaceae bacterium]